MCGSWSGGGGVGPREDPAPTLLPVPAEPNEKQAHRPSLSPGRRAIPGRWDSYSDSRPLRMERTRHAGESNGVFLARCYFLHPRPELPDAPVQLRGLEGHLSERLVDSHPHPKQLFRTVHQNRTAVAPSSRALSVGHAASTSGLPFPGQRCCRCGEQHLFATDSAAVRCAAAVWSGPALNVLGEQEHSLFLGGLELGVQVPD